MVCKPGRRVRPHLPPGIFCAFTNSCGGLPPWRCCCLIWGDGVPVGVLLHPHRFHLLMQNRRNLAYWYFWKSFDFSSSCRTLIERLSRRRLRSSTGWRRGYAYVGQVAWLRGRSPGVQALWTRGVQRARYLPGLTEDGARAAKNGYGLAPKNRA